MSLQEILRRFVKRESLPQMKEGIYEDRYDYDLEKLAKADRTVQDEILDVLKSDIKAQRDKLGKEEAEIKRVEADKQRSVYDKQIEDIKQSMAKSAGVGGGERPDSKQLVYLYTKVLGFSQGLFISLEINKKRGGVRSGGNALTYVPEEAPHAGVKRGVNAVEANASNPRYAGCHRRCTNVRSLALPPPENEKFFIFL